MGGKPGKLFCDICGNQVYSSPPDRSGPLDYHGDHKIRTINYHELNGTRCQGTGRPVDSRDGKRRK